MSDSDNVSTLLAEPRLLQELLAGKSVPEAARAAGISEATARRRLRSDGFRRQLDDGRQELLTAAVARLAAGADKAIATLLKLLDPPTPEAVRRNAAKDVLAYLAELGAGEDLRKRLSALEEILLERERAA